MLLKQKVTIIYHSALPFCLRVSLNILHGGPYLSGCFCSWVGCLLFFKIVNQLQSACICTTLLFCGIACVYKCFLRRSTLWGFLSCFSMAWQCEGCTRYWGRRHNICPLCDGRKLRLDVASLCLLQELSPFYLRRLILEFAGSKLRVLPLPKHCSLCRFGTNLNCRCEKCRCPVQTGGMYLSSDRIFLHLQRRHGHRRLLAARWVHLLSAVVATKPEHSSLNSLLIAAKLGHGPHVGLLNSMDFVRLIRHVRVQNWVWRWFAALFVEYAQSRAGARCLLDVASTTLLNLAGELHEV